MGEFDIPIEALLNEVVTIELEGDAVEVRLVDAEISLGQPGFGSGFVHFVDPDDGSKCLGFAGTNTVYDLVKRQAENHEKFINKGRL